MDIADTADEDARQFADYLTSQGWELEESDGQIMAYRDGRAMEEQEWQEALRGCF